MRIQWKLGTAALGAFVTLPFLIGAPASAQENVSCDASQFTDSGGTSSGSLSNCTGSLAGQPPVQLSLGVGNNFGTGSAGTGSFGPPSPVTGWATWPDGQVSRLEGVALGRPMSNSALNLDIKDGPNAGGNIAIDGSYSSGSAGATYGYFTPTAKATVTLP
ncbi:hypothetical protein LTV02_03925 [Nocardia yamanashiensis]|uniref:hypothetical protein n=1 Tax=Nocardia yamanashiensis TaxID=209247 RepID=UPI001E37DDFA|nr:hypothetical protein [Nocardia yamanashiensis]UGT42578.1 hypothetical protein LTV02_03925 [Nocardia yamanashiensis]